MHRIAALLPVALLLFLPNVQVSDTTGDATCTGAGIIIIKNYGKRIT
ncbi:hypothetical protein I5907_01580 [Panacibacter sp. DH6]|uniref:Uncharacterized protein n=1 Tax=Panacibacter microcysteis TaxID=2793269 RepID=A0A931DZY8_9BACT|nr:hypothetical protein [Panacibacter microcysteis]MBG9374910.1 hypothetical protein [Panacibacter microcysteis]